MGKNNCLRAYLDYYNVPGVRETCHAIKQDRDRSLYFEALETMSCALAAENFDWSSAFLIPAPQHTGSPLYTKQLAENVAEQTGSQVLDIVRCQPHNGTYANKKTGNSDFVPNFFLIGDYPDNGLLLFVDNVISSGTTYRAINILFDNRLIPLVYAVDYATLTDQDPFGLISSIRKFDCT
jgi:hypothetical protein